MTLGERIRKIRLEKGITLTYVSKKLGYKTSSALAGIENGKHGLDAEKMPILLNALGITYDELFFDEKEGETRSL